MMKKSEIQIFLAHASEDKPAVLGLYNRLKQAGYKPWLDKKDLIAGQIWRDEIPKVIKNSKIFLACISAKSANKQGYIQRELRIALDTFGEMPPGTIFFIPMRLEECEIPDLRMSEVGLNLRDIHWLDYWEKDGFEQLERAISHQFSFDPEETKQPEVVTPSLSVFNFEVARVNPWGEPLKKESKQAQYFTQELGGGITLEMIAIPGGKFFMGTEDEEIEKMCKKYGVEWFKNERPQHEVTIQPFFMGKYPITQAQWRAIAFHTDKVERNLKLNPAHFKDHSDSDNRPVEQVSWDDAVEFCARLSKLTGLEYRLPSEAEWEYACRSVISENLSLAEWNKKYNQPFHFGETITTDLANYRGTDFEYQQKVYSGSYGEGPKGQYRQETTPVGQFSPNAFGLYDMHGNVWEWCLDTWHDNYQGAPNDGSAWRESKNDNGYHLLRGGSWNSYPRSCRSAYRNYGDSIRSYSGFRVVCVPPRTSLPFAL